MPGLLPDETKIRISREILSGGPGYKAFRVGGHWKGDKDVTKRHMGRFVEMAYVPTSPEWEPPAYLMDTWWRLVNEAGNTVGLKAYIPPPERRRVYEERDPDAWSRMPHIPDPPIRWPWSPRPPASALLRRADNPSRRMGLLRRLIGPLRWLQRFHLRRR